MRKSTFLKHLNQLSEDELKAELERLYVKLSSVREYYAMELGTAEDRLKKYERVKQEIKSKYKTKSFRKPRRPRIQKINKIISDVRKTAVFDFELIDIYLFNAEEALNFMIVYNYYSEPVFNTIHNSFNKALKLIEVNQMIEEFKDQLAGIVRLSKVDRHLHKLLKTRLHEIIPGA